MKKYLLPEGGTFYKANLHCHSTISDGALSPEELKEIYKAKGYSVLAYTDHDVLIPHSELMDADFLPLNGYEMEVKETDERDSRLKKTCHMCFIALDPDNLTQVCYHRTKYAVGNGELYRDRVRFDESLPDYERDYTPACVSDMMQKGREAGFFVTYNHPAWSLETYADYGAYHNMHAMEICNYGCVVMGYPDYNEQVYDEMLRGGERIYCIAADDNHNGGQRDSRYFDSFGGFTMIKAEGLAYKTITDALLAGHFYASQGPEIHDLWFEEGRVHITCSAADRIILNTARRRAKALFSENGQWLTEADFEVLPEDGYIRITVIDAKGNHANTNAYFTTELF